MDVILLGTGGATPYASRVNPSVAIVIDDHIILFDAGSGTTQRLVQAGLSSSNIDFICLSHLHADHCLEIPLLILDSYLKGREKPITISGPAGTCDYIKAVMDSLYSYINQLIIGVTGQSPQLNIMELQGGNVASTTYGAVITCLPVVHGVPALAYKIESNQRRVVISGDTEKCDALAEFSKNADILIHECPFPPSMGHSPGHTTAKEVGEIAHQAAARLVVLTHLFEETVGQEDALVSDVKQTFNGEVVVGRDLMRL